MSADPALSSAPPAELDQALFWRLIEISTALSSERNTSRLFELILDAAQDITHADGGTLYLYKEKAGGRPVLEFEILRNDSLGLNLGGTSGNRIELPPLPVYRDDGTPNHSNIATHTALTRQMENIEDAYFAEHLDFSGTKAFDARSGYRSRSFLTVPLCNHADEIIGVLQLLNAKDPVTGEVIAFPRRLEPIIAALASSAAIALDNQILLQDHKDLLDAFIKVIAQAIDAKSAHTSAHCQRVPALTELIAQAACDAREGPLKDFDLDESDWYELHVASWMHDCGKLATPDSVLERPPSCTSCWTALMRSRRALPPPWPSSSSRSCARRPANRSGRRPCWPCWTSSWRRCAPTAASSSAPMSAASS